ncbi:hypothetical protein L1887_57826 [Cichorium endivia]|nr:hypothetical protein L1887_57826 [Cichorium endivia]
MGAENADTCGLAVRKCPTADDAPQPKSGSRTGPNQGCRAVPTDIGLLGMVRKKPFSFGEERGKKSGKGGIGMECGIGFGSAGARLVGKFRAKTSTLLFGAMTHIHPPEARRTLLTRNPPKALHS